MDSLQHLEILKQGVTAWNEWRRNNPHQKPELSRTDLSGANLSGADLNGANLHRADLSGTNLRRTNLSRANLSGADLNRTFLSRANLADANLHRTFFRHANLNDVDLTHANLSHAFLLGAFLKGANLRHADFTHASLSRADLSNSDLSHADLSDADITHASLSHADLAHANFTKTIFGYSLLSDVDLSGSFGLESTEHSAPSSIGIDTLYKSRGKIPAAFLRGCGVPDSFILQAKALIGAEEGIQFYSCFISYSGLDDEFARRLHGRLQQDHVRVWFSPHDIQGGKKLHEQIDEAIKVYDKLLILLSPHSLQSEWVMTELRKARKAERKTGKRKLFPVRLVDYETLQEWECFDADGGQDLAAEVREYFIPDFTHWKDHDAFETAYARLLKDLRAATQRAV